MLARLTLAALLATTALTPAMAQLQATAEAAGDTARACVAFPRALSSDAEAHPGDFLALEPAVQTPVGVSGGQLCLEGLAYGTRYTLTVRPGLLFANGTRQAAADQAVIETPDRDAAVAIAGRGWILPRQGATGVTVQTMNVPRVRIRVLRMSAQRLAAEMPGTTARWNRIDPAKQQFSVWELQQLTENRATEIWSGTMQTKPGRNVLAETAFPLAGIVDPSKPGAYLVLAENAAEPPIKLEPGGRYDRATYDTNVAGHWVLSTDLAISTAQSVGVGGQDGLHVTVRSLGSAAPLPWVKLQLLSLAQDVLGEAVTDADGAAWFAPGLLRGKRGASAAVLMAHTDSGDMALQDLTAPGFDLSDRGAEGRVSPGPIEAYVYTDRGIYRPGETVNLVALLRTLGLSAVDGAALTLVLRRPDGVEASRTLLPPAPDAGFVQPIPLSKTAAQGSWTIEAYVDPSLPPIGRATVEVRDFVPQQLAVTLTGPPQPLNGTAHLTGSIDGRFLYGAPAAGLHAEGDIRLVRDEHPVPGARDYSFGIPDETITSAPQPLELKDADAAGHVAIDAALHLPDDVASPLRAVVDAGLTEPTGRAVRETVSVPIHNHPLLIGLRPLFGDRVDSGSPARFAIRTFDGQGNPAARLGLQWRLLRQVTHWNWWRGEGGTSGWTFHTYTTEGGVAEGSVDVAYSQPAALERTLEWGEYRLVVSDPATGAASSVRFSVGWGSGSADTDVPDRLEVSSDRATIGIGDTAHIHLRGPFAGPAQIVVESAGRVLETRRLDLPAAGTTLDLTATEAWGPGVHVLAEAFRPLAAPAGAHDPVRAVGLAWVAVDPAPHTLTVSIEAPGLVTPRQAVAVPVHVAGAHGRAFVTLAAVDEGILRLTHFTSPDPVAALLGRTRFGLDLRDDYGRLLHGADIGAVQEGGDEGAALGGQGLPVTTTRTVSLFHGPVELDASGNATVTLDLPDFAGELRLMAVAYDHVAAGHAEAPLTVRDPVVAELSLPRFLAPGDVAGLGVSLHDTDGPQGAYHLAVTATGAAELRGQGELDIQLGHGERREARMELAGTSVGIGHVSAVLTGPGNLRVTHEWDIAVRSPHPDLVLSRTDAQAPGDEYKPSQGLLAVFVPGSAQMTIGYSAFAGIDVPGLLQSLYTYPYGCTEQLASAGLPLLYFSDARLLGHPAGDPAVRSRVQAAIDTIADRQDNAGRFGLWHVGDGSGSVWLNVYVLDFLLHAREAGFKVADRVTTSSAQWVQRRLDQDGDDIGGAYAQPALPTRAYAAYVLARSSRVDPARLRELASALEWQTQDAAIHAVSWRNAGLAAPLSLAQLAGAQGLMGSPSSAGKTFDLALANLDSPAPSWWYNATFWSRLRDEAGVLAVAAETGQDQVVASLLQRIASQHLQPSALNTQEKAWLLMAAHALGKRGTTRVLSVGGGAPVPVALPYAVSPSTAELAAGITVRNAGNETVFRTVTLRGAPVEAPPAISAGFSVRRDTVSLAGDTLDDTALRQTDRFIVVLSGTLADGAFRRAVAVDPLPGGLEIEGLVQPGQYNFLGQLTKLRAHEERDDRFIAAFDIGSEARFNTVDDTKAGALEPNQYRIAYVVRAVTPGRFVRPETVVEDMYHPEVMARTAAAAITVAPR